MSSELELLRQRISELEIKNTKLEAEKAELLKQVMEKDAKRDAENTELKSKVGELEARLLMLEHGVTEATERLENDKETMAEVSAVDVPDSVIDQQNDTNTESMEELPEIPDKVMDDFILEESINMPDSVIADGCLPVVNYDPAQPKQCKPPHIEEVTTKVNSDQGRSLEDRKTDVFLDKVHKKKVSDEIRQRKREKKLEEHNLLPEATSQKKSDSEQTAINRKGLQSSQTPYNQKVERDLREELSSYSKGSGGKINKAFDIQIPDLSLEAVLTGSSVVTAQNIVDLFRIAIKVRQKEILCWYCFYKAYENRVRDIKSVKNINEQSARTLVYSEIKALLPDITDVNLRQKKIRAKRIYLLFTGIGIDKIQVVTSSASAVSGLSDNQIEGIINDFQKKADEMVGVTNCNAHVTESSEVSVPTIPNLSTHVSNSSDNSKEEAWFDENMFFNEANPTKVNITTSDDDDSNSSDSEEEMPDDDEDNGYGGYNEYGEYDRGYYYRDGRYERKTSPMMSPIISPVTA
ncbi:hypothetical protein RhiirB3_451854 [Rhizophagus irregularis]|nr:hypothetical protein RhiirB3_451854 [Rhizophagus irregularis]